MWAELHYHAGALAVYANPPDWNEMQAWRNFLREGDLFIDVGANVGTYTVWATDCGADVIAIEPDPDACARLVTNAEMASTKVTVLNAAAAAERGTVSLTIGFNAMNRIVVEGQHAFEARVVPAITLDELIGDQHVRGIKIDVEGAERLVLEGVACALREQRIEMIQIEWNDRSIECLGETREPVAALLAAFGYGLCRPNESGILIPLAEVGFGPDVFSRPEEGANRQDTQVEPS